MTLSPALTRWRIMERSKSPKATVIWNDHFAVGYSSGVDRLEGERPIGQTVGYTFGGAPSWWYRSLGSRGQGGCGRRPMAETIAYWDCPAQRNVQARTRVLRCRMN